MLSACGSGDAATTATHTSGSPTTVTSLAGGSDATTTAATAAATSTTATGGMTASTTDQSATAATTATAAGSSPAGEVRRSPGCGTALAAGLKPGTTTEQTWDQDGTPRKWLVHVPARYTPDAPQWLVFNFHGANSNPEQQMLYTRIAPLADRDGAIVVAPKSETRAWQPFGPKDSGLIDHLITQIPAGLCVDLNRVYATGMSSGAYMTATLACRRPDVFAAYGAVTANFYLPKVCGKSPMTDIVSFHGTADPIVAFGTQDPVNGIATGGGVASTFATQWARHDGCAATPTDTPVGTDVVHREWTGCKPGGSVSLYVVKDGGHTWPGSVGLPKKVFGKTTSSVDATSVIWDLFSRHTLND